MAFTNPTGEDFRGLEPPEPLLRTLRCLEEPTVGRLHVVYDRMPYLLFPELDQRGFGYEVETRHDGVYVEIMKRGRQGK
jgi:hypothetical protein